MNPPDWMLPKGTHGVREAQIRKDWRDRSRRRAMIDVAREDEGSPVEMNNRLVGLVCADLLRGGAHGEG